MFKLRAFTDDQMLILENPLQGVGILMEKLNDVGMLAGSKVSNQKAKMLTENMTTEDEKVLKQGFNLEKVKYLDIIVANVNCMLLQNNYVKT